MCQFNDNFKLCSCDAEELNAEEIDWILERINPENPLRHRRGKASIPRYNQEEQQQLDAIVSILNQRNCFDFDFQAMENDRLRLKINQQFYAFRFQEGQWELDKSTILHAWRTQLEPYKSGKMEER